MGKFYGQALMVYLRLGEEADDRDLAVELIEPLASRASDPADPKSYSCIPQLSQLRPWTETSSSSTRPFCDRLWVLQKIVLG
jgi:hypothetical protein